MVVGVWVLAVAGTALFVFLMFKKNKESSCVILKPFDFSKNRRRNVPSRPRLRRDILEKHHDTIGRLAKKIIPLFHRSNTLLSPADIYDRVIYLFGSLLCLLKREDFLQMYPFICLMNDFAGELAP